MAVKIQNVVTTAELKQQVDASKFVKYPWGIYDHAYYGGLCGYVKDHKIRGKVTIFFSGKMISIGAKNIRDSIQQLEYAMEILANEGFVKRTKLHPLVRNIVGTINVSSGLDLKKIALSFEKSIFEPDIFPSVICRTLRGTVFHIFSNGTVIITGAKSEEQLLDSAKRIEHIMTRLGISIA